MIEIHQAIFGQGQDKGHSLLRSSYSNDSIVTKLSGYTDLVDRPQNGVLSTPIVRGFVINDHFLLVKSFPDPTGRPGRVFSHAVIVKMGDYLKLKDVSDLRQFHLKEINKEYSPEIIYYDNSLEVPVAEPNEKMLHATNELINHPENNNTIAWVGEIGYWEWISMIWPQLPDNVKKNMNLGNAFNTRHLNKESLNLIIVSEEIKSNWLTGGYAIIDNKSSNTEVSDKTLRSYILGRGATNNYLEILLKELRPQIAEIDDLALFNEFAELYCHIEDAHPFRELLMLSDLISRYNPDIKSSISAKNKLIDALAESISRATPEEFFSLQYQTWAGYDERHIHTTIGNAMQMWLNENLLKLDDHQPAKTKIAVSSLGTSKNDLWHRKVQDFFVNAIKAWQPFYREIIWEWLAADGAFIKQIFLLLPDNAEDDMVESLPDLDKRLSDAIIPVVQNKGWIGLLGMMAIKNLPSQKAFEKVLSATENEDQSILEKMAAIITPEQFLIDVCEINDDSLIPIAVKKLKAQPSLKLKLDISNLAGQKIWVSSVQAGLDVWAGINTPKAYLYDIVDKIIEGHSFDEALLKEIAQSQFNSLKDYPKRDLAWALLPSNCKNYFLVGTLKECLIAINVGKMSLDKLEQPLSDCLESSEIKKFIINASDLSITTKLDIIDCLEAFTEEQTKELIEENIFTQEASERLGNLVQSKKWKQVAKHIFTIRDRRPDLKLAMQNCSKYLEFWDRLSLTFSGYNVKIVSQEEFWMALYEIAIALYPEGPNQNGLWERAGGNKADLHKHGSGKQIWWEAISHIRKGDAPTQKKLLEKMMEDHQFNDLLKQLKHII